MYPKLSYAFGLEDTTISKQIAANGNGVHQKSFNSDKCEEL